MNLNAKSFAVICVPLNGCVNQHLRTPTQSLILSRQDLKLDHLPDKTKQPKICINIIF